jgi:acyl carrier protein
MNREELTLVLKETLSAVVPEIDWQSIDHRADLRDQVDIDSMDMFNWVVALHQRLGIDIPEVDVPKLVTLDGAAEYLGNRIDSRQTGPGH